MLKKYFEGYQSEQDDDYNPTNKELAIYNQQQLKKRTRTSKLTSHQLYLEMKEQQQKKQQIRQKLVNKEATKQQTKRLAQQIMNNKQIKPDRKIIFAGKEFLLNEQTGQLQLIEKKLPANLDPRNIANDKNQDNQRQRTQIAFRYLNHVMQAIYNRGRKINSIGKSKLDWKGFVKQEGIQQKLNYNRKGGVIEDMKFMKKAK